MRRTLAVAGPWLVALLALAAPAYGWSGHVAEACGAVWLTIAILAGCATLGALVPATRVRAHAAIAAALMLTVAGFAVTRVIERWPFQWDAMPDRRYAAFIAALGVAVAIGLYRGAFWARWSAMAFAASSALGGALNALNMFPRRDEPAWLAGAGLVGGLLLWSELARPAVRAHFARHQRHALWTSRDPLVVTARWAAIAAFAAAPMLILYALGQPVAPRTVTSALVLAPLLGLGAILVVTRRAVGTLVLAATGLALLAHTAATAEYTIAGGLPVVEYYAAFWIPAAVLGIVAGALALSRARR
jgi:hypothetical protein